MTIHINTRKKGLIWRLFHTCEFERIEEVHYWEHECKRGHPNYPKAFNRWYLFSYDIGKCKHCGKIRERKFDNIVLPIGGRDVCYRTIY